VKVRCRPSSQVVKLGREIEARSANSCWVKPVRLRAARNIPPVISTIVMSRLWAQRRFSRQRKDLLPSVDTANRPWPTSVAPRRNLPIGQRVARSFPERWPAGPLAGRLNSRPAQDHQLALRGSLVAAPSDREQEWTPREHGTLSTSASCRCSAQPLPGLWITTFSARSLPRSVPPPFSAPHLRRAGADMDKASPQTRIGLAPFRQMERRRLRHPCRWRRG
jgi:hypothetical protein